MSNFKLFLVSISNSFRSDGYYNVVTSPKKIGFFIDKINDDRRKNLLESERRIDVEFRRVSPAIR
jgi:hypothetical protein